MAVKTKNSAKSGNKNKNTGRKILKFLLVMILLSVILGGGVALFSWFEKELFSANPHFVFHGAETSSVGYWNGRNREIEALLGLKLNEDNLFAINLKKIRADLIAIPNVKDASVERILPDILRLQLEERIPRATLAGSKFVIDDSTVIIPRTYCSGNFPVIGGLDRRIKLIPGNDIPELQPVINLIMTRVKYFPEFELNEIWISHPDRILFTAVYRNAQYKIYFPRKQDFRYSFMQLKEGIETNLRNRVKAVSYDLTNKAKIISR